VNGRSYGTPKVISISWGLPEIYYSATQLTTMNNIMAAAVAKGINICVATGDNGSNDGVGGIYSYADFPSSSPNCTAVGGTNLVCHNSTNTYTGTPRAVETAWSSGGGAISAYFTKPTYQSAISAAARSTPDISSDADPNTGVAFLVNATAVIYGGTSVAAPTIAAFLAATGISTFVNPLLYSAPSTCLHDIITGTNGSYTCKTGYDNCTGLGTVNGSTMAAYLLGYRAVSSLALNSRSLTINVGQTATLVVTILPANASNKNVTWTTTNPNIASVSSVGLVTGVGAGSATITCKSNDTSAIVVTCAVTVKSVAVTSVTISGPHIVQKGKAVQLAATVLPTNATVKTVTWASSNTNANVSRTGLVTGLKVGVANIVCTATNNVSSLPFSITVTA
jgi:kumamolisin